MPRKPKPVIEFSINKIPLTERQLRELRRLEKEDNLTTEQALVFIVQTELDEAADINGED